MTRSNTVLLVLFTIFNSQNPSRGSLLEVEASTPPNPELLLSNSIDTGSEELEEVETPELDDYYDSLSKTSELIKRSINEQPSRRSSTDRNFQRFGRSGFFPSQEKNIKEKNLIRLIRGAKDNFMRFGRGQRDFMRFGRGGQNFMRFGKADKNFMRFGKADKNFMRFGKSDKNFMRFGKADKNFMRFGRNDEEVPIEDELEEYERIERPDKNFLRFGKSANNFMRFGKNDKNFMRFGKADKNFMRFGREVKRTERDVDDAGVSLWQLEEENGFDSLARSSRDQRNTNSKSPHIRFGRNAESVEEIGYGPNKFQDLNTISSLELEGNKGNGSGDIQVQYG